MKSILKASHLAALVTACVFLTASAQAQSWITNGLVAYYPFNGNANDASGHGKDGSVNNGILTPDRFGALNTAYSFAGVGGIGLPTSTLIGGNTNGAITFWFNKSDSSTNQQYFFAGSGLVSGTPNRYYVFAETNQLKATFGCPSQDIFGSAIIVQKWNQVCVVWTNTGNSVTLYQNGLQIGTISGASLKPTIDAVSLASWKLQGSFLNGAIDDVRIYNRALSSNEVAQLYLIESVPPSLGITTYSNSPVVFYPTVSGTNFTLQMATNLNTPIWLAVTNGEPFSGVRITNAPPNAFFRLN